MIFLFRLAFALAVLLPATASYFIIQNNRPLPEPDNTRLTTTLENSIRWLVNNREFIIQADNPMLLRMIQKASELSGDDRLKRLFSDWSIRYFEPGIDNIWRPLIYPNTWIPFRLDQINHLPAYNRFFVYGYTCDNELRATSEIQAQLDPDYCAQFLFSPSCETHQLMGLLLVRQSECVEAELVDSTISRTQSRIRQKLIFDPRLSDAFMQRVLMLADSGATDLIKPVWITRLINAQQIDGGWSPFIPFINLGNRRTIGLNNGKLRLDRPKSNFHMTAQGVLLFTLLTNNRRHH